MESYKANLRALGTRLRRRSASSKIVLLALMVTFFFAACGALTEKGDPYGIKVGDKAVDFTLPTPTDSVVSLGQFDGQPIVLYFWASWCGTCTFDLPDLATVANREADNGLVTITVNVGEEPEFVERYVEDQVGQDYRFVVASDTSLDTFRQYRILSFPTTFFVGRDGVIQSMRVGRISEGLLTERIRELS